MPAKKLAITGAATAVFCILAPVSIPLPVSPVPVSLTSLILFVILYILGWQAGTICYLIYLFMGMLGLPVFSGFSGGMAKLAGPTGGYLAGFIFTALISGWMIEHSGGRRWLEVIGMILGMLAAYLSGTIWLSHLSGNSFRAALIQGVLPFLAGDAVKIVAAVTAAPVLKKRLKRAGVCL